MRHLFRFGCLKPKTSDGDDSLLRYPGSKVGNGDGYGNGGAAGVSRWQTPPLGKGAKQHLPGYQVSTSSSTANIRREGFTEHANDFCEVVSATGGASGGANCFVIFKCSMVKHLHDSGKASEASS